jgi:type VI secretion system protein ImpB
MDGKAGAEDLIAKVLQDPALLQTLAAQPAPDDAGKGE